MFPTQNRVKLETPGEVFQTPRSSRKILPNLPTVSCFRNRNQLRLAVYPCFCPFFLHPYKIQSPCQMIGVYNHLPKRKVFGSLGDCGYLSFGGWNPPIQQDLKRSATATMGPRRLLRLELKRSGTTILTLKQTSANKQGIWIYMEPIPKTQMYIMYSLVCK